MKYGKSGHEELAKESPKAVVQCSEVGKRGHYNVANVVAFYLSFC